jgi:hypothetical protein
MAVIMVMGMTMRMIVTVIVKAVVVRHGASLARALRKSAPGNETRNT